jgi:hypothetical protein
VEAHGIREFATRITADDYFTIVMQTTPPPVASGFLKANCSHNSATEGSGGREGWVVVLGRADSL